MAAPYSLVHTQSLSGATCDAFTDGAICYDAPVFNATGTRMYIIRRVNVSEDRPCYLDEYFLLTAWDITSLAYSNSMTLTDLQTHNTSVGMYLKPNGAALYILGTSTTYGTNSLFSIAFGTPGDISTASLLGVYDSGLPDESQYTGLSFSSDGMFFYSILGYSSTLKKVKQVQLGGAWDVSSSLGVLNTAYIGDTFSESYVEHRFSADGKHLYVKNYTGLSSLSLTTAWDISTLAETEVLELSSGFGSFWFNTDESKLYALGRYLTEFLVEYDSTPVVPPTPLFFWTNFHGETERV